MVQITKAMNFKEADRKPEEQALSVEALYARMEEEIKNVRKKYL